MKHLKLYEDSNILYSNMMKNTYWVYKSHVGDDIIMKILITDDTGKGYEILNQKTQNFINLYYSRKHFMTFYCDDRMIRKATQKEIEDFEMNKQTNKYNL